jgi:hypothetical protein
MDTMAIGGSDVAKDLLHVIYFKKIQNLKIFSF